MNASSRVPAFERAIRAAREAATSLPDYQPAFNTSVGWADTYDQLFAGSFSRKTASMDVIDRVKSGARILIVAKGGGAKSSLLSRLARAALDRGFVPVPISLRAWKVSDSEYWRQLENNVQRVRFLIERFSPQGLKVAELDSLPSSTVRLLLIDGLNEVDSVTGQQLLYGLDEYAMYGTNTAVVISDRVSRREFLSPDRWDLGFLLPLEPIEIKRVLAEDNELLKGYELSSPDEKLILTSPFFLDEFMKSGEVRATRSATFAAYFRQHTAEDADLNRLPSAAFQAYRGASRTFSIKEFTDIAGQALADKLIDSGVIATDGSLAHFAHHLMHDYWVAVYLSSNSQHWNRDVFKIATFHGSSFDVVTMAMEMIDAPDDASHFVRQLFDWNPYAAGYAIAEGRHTKIGVEMQLVILALFTERRWDNIVATSQKASDTLALIEGLEAAKLRAATSYDALFSELISVSVREPWFSKWLSLYTTTKKDLVEDWKVQCIVETDSVFGWTAANVLRRCTLSESDLNFIVSLVHNSSPSVRWRAAHVLGAFTSAEHVKVLLELVRDSDDLVRYGAVRALVEQAAADESLAETIFRGLRDNLNSIVSSPAVLAELERAVFVRKKPNSWLKLVLPLLNEIQAVTESAEEIDRWDLTIRRLVEGVAA